MGTVRGAPLEKAEDDALTRAALGTVPNFLLGLAALLMFAAMSPAQIPASSYRVENVPTPRGIAPEVSAVTFGKDGLLYATFRQGYIYAHNPRSGQWRRFASGLHLPLGIIAGEEGEFFVAQMPELTRVADTDGDGEADVYEAISDDWGMSGNYHEFIGGPIRDAEGNFYIGLGVSSPNAEPRPPVRGELTDRGRVTKNPVEGNVNTIRFYSPTSYRGCVVRISADGEFSPFACGVRQPNGLGFDAEGEIFAADNQGGWVGTSPLHHITEGAFHGHPASLNWDPRFEGRDPAEATVAELESIRKRPAILFPQNDMGGSTAQPLLDDTGGKFGPYAGQMLVAEWTYPRILRADLEKVGGEYQGAAFILIEQNGLHRSNNRIAFSPEGDTLYVAQTSHFWGSTESLQRIIYTGKTPMDILHMRLTKPGFDLTFTKPVDRASAGEPSAYSFTHYYYKYHAQYGSPKTDVTPATVTGVAVSDDGLRVALTLDGLVAGRVYELRPNGIQGIDGEPLATRVAAYTLNRLK